MKKSKKQKVNRTILKVIGFITTGILISMILSINMDTYSWFTSKTAYDMSVTAATTDDILEEIEIDKVNPEEIVLKKNLIDIEPVIYFSVDGEISDYILHINPIRLKTHERYIIPINVTVNLQQIMDLLMKNKKRIYGTIKIKYLNEYIDEERNIEFTREYLLTKLLNRLGIQYLDVDNKFEKEEYLKKVMMYIAEEGELQSNEFYKTVIEEVYGNE
ncbi:hypothetical protein SAMN02745135_01414 [Caloranaerobacter azorensis DSM 13643]|uniref:Uncharacterized protein n=1 Tax=Caloranaerobacter azorensis DSM 13643 TaxID=1121264 RepID=A0A1M5UG45_9FIRM|nr:hypothetical protein [Caloranaerobacter azorensis]SHH61949.1 hypothetical protein SAMN02745135_01414 [Caloranaerobacter azorensis DSM 13643]